MGDLKNIYPRKEPCHTLKTSPQKNAHSYHSKTESNKPAVFSLVTHGNRQEKETFSRNLFFLRMGIISEKYVINNVT